MYRLLLLAAALPAAAQLYPVAIDQDALSGAPDFGFLNAPLTAADRIFARDGHFFRVGPDREPFTADDQRVRFFGVNLAFGASFPAAEDAPRIARRLRRLGVNLARLHHMDSQPDANPANAGSLLTRGPYPTLNPEAIARLRRFLDALAAEGIYVNLNLHVGYQFRPAVDGVPDAAIPTQSKPLHILLPRMVELQERYAREVIAALRLAGDPVLALVEIDNESSLLDSWQRNSLDAALAGEYRRELERQWNTFLAARYGSTEALRAAWGGGEPDGPELLAPSGWRTEIHAPAQASLLAADPVTVRVAQGGRPVIVKQVGFSIETGRPYLAQIEMRADLPPGESRSVYWDVKQDVSPWRTEAGRTVAITGEWQKFTMAFEPAFAMESIGRFAVSVENVAGGSVYLRNWSLKQAGRRGLGENESLESAGVAPVGSGDVGTQSRTDDYLLFLAARDRAYLDRIRDAVRDAAGPLVPVAGTQMGFGGLLNLDSHAALDFQDNHFYVDHYAFPNVAWDDRDWYIREQSAIGTGLAAFANMAAARPAGLPYTVSEFNQPWPNTCAAEIVPALAAFAAFQDWDGIVHFAYSHGRNWDDNVPNGFNLNGDWTKFPGFAQSAWLFRSGAVRPGLVPVALPVSRELRLRAAREKRNGAIAAFLTAAAGYDPAAAFVHPVRLALDDDVAPAPPATEPGVPYAADTGEFTYDAAARLLLLDAPRAAGVFGVAGARRATAGPLDVELAGSARGFAAVLLTSLDGRPLAASARLLLSNPGYTLRSLPGSDPPRPQALVPYGGYPDRWTAEPEPGSPRPSGARSAGALPVWMERVEAWLTLRSAARSLVVYPLDGAGARLDPLPSSDVQRSAGGFRIHLQADGQAWTPWYEIVVPE